MIENNNKKANLQNSQTKIISNLKLYTISQDSNGSTKYSLEHERIKIGYILSSFLKELLENVFQKNKTFKEDKKVEHRKPCIERWVNKSK